MVKQTKLWERILAVAIGLIVWQIAADTIQLNILLVGPWQVFLRLGTIWREEGFFAAILYSFYHIMRGYLLGLCVGICCASVAYRFRLAETLLWPWMTTIKAVPVASFIVICLIWLSTDRLSIFISFLIVVPIAYQNTLVALRGIDSSLTDLCRMEQISYPRLLVQILYPQIIPQLISTASITAGMAWKAGIAAEIIGTPKGSVGTQLFMAKIYLDTDDLLAWTVVIVVVSVVFEKIFVGLLKLLFLKKRDY